MELRWVRVRTGKSQNGSREEHDLNFVREREGRIYTHSHSRIWTLDAKSRVVRNLNCWRCTGITGGVQGSWC